MHPAIGCAVLIGTAYVAAGSKLAAAIQRPELRARLEWGVGAMFLAIAVAVIANLVNNGGL